MVVAALSLPSSSSTPRPNSLFRPKPRPRLPRAAIVEARPSPIPSPAGGGGGANGIPRAEPPAAIKIYSRDRAEDLQAEAKAMARAVNASAYSPELLDQKYGSRPIKVRFLTLVC